MARKTLWLITNNPINKYYQQPYLHEFTFFQGEQIILMNQLTSLKVIFRVTNRIRSVYFDRKRINFDINKHNEDIGQVTLLDML